MSLSTNSMVFIELNDWQLSVRNAQGATLAADCAAAALTKSGLVFGHPALATARSEPQRFNNRYLTSVNADPLGNDMGIARNSADLLYHHLVSLDLPKDPVMVAIPGHYSNEQLGLLLGIMNEASVNVRGFVDTPLAHVLNLELPPRYRLLDVEWHRFSLTELERIDGEHRIRSTTSLEHIGGVAALVDRWMNVIADDFIKKTRFDPLHNGATEQIVYNQVSSWLEQGVLSDQRITISQSGTVREHEVSSSLLRNRLAEQLLLLELDPTDEPLILTHRLANIPGVLDCFAERGFTTGQSSPDEVLLNLVSLANRLNEEGITRITAAAAVSTTRPVGTTVGPQRAHVASQVSATDSSVSDSSVSDSSVSDLSVSDLSVSDSSVSDPFARNSSNHTAKQAATHLLDNNRAIRIGDPHFTDYFDQAGCITHPNVKLNGRRAIGAHPTPGDAVDLDGRSFIAIRVD